MKHLISVLIVFAAGTGCREGAPIPDYTSEQDAFDRATADAAPPQEAPDPFVDGETRLVISTIFNESGASEFIQVDGSRTNYFIFDNGSGQNTYDQADDEFRVEGSVSQKLTLEPIAATFGWGGGFILDPTVDLTPYDVIVVYLASATITDVVIRIADLAGEVAINPANFGFAADGEYHEVRIPLSEFSDQGVDLSQVRIPFAIGGGAQDPGQEMFVDYLYWEAE